MGINILYVLWIFVGIHGVTSQGDSLRSALNEVERRQRYYHGNNPILFPHESPDLSYLPDSDSIGGNDLLEYFSDDEGDGKQISSSFRERQEEKGKQLEELSQRVLSNLGDDTFENSVYRSRDPWRKYKNDYYGRNDRMNTRKRQFYPDFGYDSIGLRKRDKFTPADYSNEYNYLYNMNNDDYPNDYLENFAYTKRLSLHDHENHYSNSRPSYWSNFRHIPVTKRSSEYPKPIDKKQPIKTDPKIEKDLSVVFSGPEKKKNQTIPKKVEATKKEKRGSEKNQKKINNSKVKPEMKKNETKKTTEEMASEKPIQISKKSIDWSDYLGLDRRKKSNDFDKEWVMDRYHKAIAVSKKNVEYPLQSFRVRDDTKKIKRTKNENDDSKLENMDRKLKSIEDEIVDDALKYTGANEGVTDPKDIEEVEDGIISRLAKAYSIEKMRRALGEYKMLVDKEREKLRREEEEEEEDVNDDTFSEEKRVSVPRKQAVDPNRDDKPEDNHIKCTQGDADCNEENYKIPIEIIEQLNYEVGGCPKIQRDCRQVAALHGQYARVFEEACNIHQMCLLCGNNSWYPATKQCNILFLSKVYDVCEGKADCQKEMQKSVRYLMNINRSIRDNPSGDCNLVCPDGPDGA